jgi:hypothetical protein
VSINEGRSINTLYSNIYDLKLGIVYLYYGQNYSDVKKIFVADLSAKRQPPTAIKDEFSQEVIEKAALE